MHRLIPVPGTLCHRLLIAAVGVLLLAGAVEVHLEAEHPVDLRERLVWTCDHDRPASGRHAEAARAELREACPACLHRLQAGDAGLTAAAGFFGMAVAEPCSAEYQPAPSPAPSRRHLARGPPTFS